MKVILLSLIAALMPPLAFACPGGHLKILTWKKTAVAQVDFSANRVKILDSNSELLTVAHTPSGTEITQLICGWESMDTCDHDQGVPVALTSDPSSTLHVRIDVDGREVEFNVTGFRLKRGSSCAEEIEGQ